MLGISKEDKNNIDIVEEAYQEEVFKITSFFLNRMFIPKLAKTRISRLESIENAFRLLSRNSEFSSAIRDSDSISLNESSLVDLVQSMQEIEMKVKLGLARATQAPDSIIQLEAWIKLFESYSKAFVRIYAKQELIQELQIPVTTQIEYGEMIREFKAENYSLWGAKEYARLAKIIG